MTEIVETRGDQALTEALAMIDAGLAEMGDRQLVAASEVSDLLLDLRLLLMRAEAQFAAN